MPPLPRHEFARTLARLLAIAAAFLLCGAAFSWLSAWIAVPLVTLQWRTGAIPAASSKPVTQGIPADWSDPVLIHRDPHRWGQEDGYERRGIHYSYTLDLGLNLVPVQPDAMSIQYLRVRSYGYPMRCLQCCFVDTPYSGTPSSWQYAIDANLPVLGRLYLPTRPLVKGLAFNAIAYGALFYLLWSTPRIIRHIRRRRAGWCLGCGYDLKASTPGAPCPECGRQP